MTLNQLTDDLRRQFMEQYRRPPRWMAAAPGRVNLIGEHTDYNDGFVLPMAIDRYTVVAASPSDRSGPAEIHWNCSRTGETAIISLTSPIAKGEPRWSNYIRGVLEGFRERGFAIPALDVIMGSSVPLGSGLSSSAALEVATATLLEAVLGISLDPVDKALLCQKAEHQYAGVPCGIMDQFTSILGRKDHLILLDCRSHEVMPVSMPDPEVEVLIINTNVKHDLSGGEYAERRQQCHDAANIMGVPSLRDADRNLLERHRESLGDVTFRRARHVITEIDRTLQAVEAISKAEWLRLGDLMEKSHASLRDDYEVSCPELDLVVDLSRQVGAEAGVIGCRMTGGGFGGCAVALVRQRCVPDIVERLTRGYRQKAGIDPTLFVSRPASGAQIIASTLDSPLGK